MRSFKKKVEIMILVLTSTENRLTSTRRNLLKFERYTWKINNDKRNETIIMYPQREFSSCGNSKQNITYLINQEEDQRSLIFLC